MGKRGMGKALALASLERALDERISGLHKGNLFMATLLVLLIIEFIQRGSVV